MLFGVVCHSLRDGRIKIEWERRFPDFVRSVKVKYLLHVIRRSSFPHFDTSETMLFTIVCHSLHSKQIKTHWERSETLMTWLFIVILVSHVWRQWIGMALSEMVDTRIAHLSVLFARIYVSNSLREKLNKKINMWWFLSESLVSYVFTIVHWNALGHLERAWSLVIH